MEIHQILVRPRDEIAIILYEDVVGNRNSLVISTTGNTAVGTLVAQCRDLLPSDSENPDKTDIEREIQALQDRLVQLKSAIGSS